MADRAQIHPVVSQLNAALRKAFAGDPASAVRAHDAVLPLLQSIAATPSSRWAADGQPDPHVGQYDCERAALMMGDMTDDEMANAVFLHGNERPSMTDLAAGAMPAIAYLTAAKERIRWLSRHLEVALAKLAGGQQTVIWHGAHQVPSVSPRDYSFYWVAVRRENGKVYTMPATFANRVELEGEEVREETVQYNRARFEVPAEHQDCCSLATGWFDIKGSSEYDSLFEPLLGKKDELVAWREVGDYPGVDAPDANASVPVGDKLLRLLRHRAALPDSVELNYVRDGDGTGLAWWDRRRAELHAQGYSLDFETSAGTEWFTLDGVGDELRAALAEYDAAPPALSIDLAPDTFFVQECPGWPGGISLHSMGEALRLIQQHGNSYTKLSTYRHQHDRIDYTPEKTRALLEKAVQP